MLAQGLTVQTQCLTRKNKKNYITGPTVYGSDNNKHTSLLHHSKNKEIFYRTRSRDSAAIFFNHSGGIS
jgi:hypothetical protein